MDDKIIAIVHQYQYQYQYHTFSTWEWDNRGHSSRPSWARNEIQRGLMYPPFARALIEDRASLSAIRYRIIETVWDRIRGPLYLGRSTTPLRWATQSRRPGSDGQTSRLQGARSVWHPWEKGCGGYVGIVQALAKTKMDFRRKTSKTVSAKTTDFGFWREAKTKPDRPSSLWRRLRVNRKWNNFQSNHGQKPILCH